MARRAKKASRKRKGSHLSPQLVFGFKRREGHRVGRPAKADSGVPHLVREALGSRFPVHVVLTIDEGLPSLRKKHPFKALRRAFMAGRDRFGFRLNHFSVQGNHLHFIVEAKDRTALSRGLKGLSVRIAKALNKLWKRKGRVFGDRYFDRILRTPREVKNALNYVLKNGHHHGRPQVIAPEAPIDVFSSGMFFDGWREFRLEDFEVNEPPPLAKARTWLLRKGWRRHGLLTIQP
jgi:putative transposase